jgi:hypothetical protein
LLRLQQLDSRVGLERLVVRVLSRVIVFFIRPLTVLSHVYLLLQPVKIIVQVDAVDYDPAPSLSPQLASSDHAFHFFDRHTCDSGCLAYVEPGLFAEAQFLPLYDVTAGCGLWSCTSDEFNVIHGSLPFWSVG